MDIAGFRISGPGLQTLGVMGHCDAVRHPATPAPVRGAVRAAGFHLDDAVGGGFGQALLARIGNPRIGLLDDKLHHPHAFGRCQGLDCFDEGFRSHSITFKLADATTRVVLRTAIAELRGANVSLMPDGLEAGLSQQDMADLNQFLRSGETKPRASAAGGEKVTGGRKR